MERHYSNIVYIFDRLNTFSILEFEMLALFLTIKYMKLYGNLYWSGKLLERNMGFCNARNACIFLFIAGNLFMMNMNV